MIRTKITNKEGTTSDDLNQIMNLSFYDDDDFSESSLSGSEIFSGNNDLSTMRKEKRHGIKMHVLVDSSKFIIKYTIYL